MVKPRLSFQDTVLGGTRTQRRLGSIWRHWGWRWIWEWILENYTPSSALLGEVASWLVKGWEKKRVISRRHSTKQRNTVEKSPRLNKGSQGRQSAISWKIELGLDVWVWEGSEKATLKIVLCTRGKYWKSGEVEKKQLHPPRPPLIGSSLNSGIEDALIYPKMKAPARVGTSPGQGLSLCPKVIAGSWWQFVLICDMSVPTEGNASFVWFVIIYNRTQSRLLGVSTLEKWDS